MASISILLATLLLVALPAAMGQSTTPAAPAPSPPGPVNLTAILTKGGQFTTLLRLLRETQVGVQLTSQLNNSFNGLTLFAPTDNAFASLKPGTLNSLTNQEQVELLLFHVLPQYYTLDNFQTVSNPLQTQGSSSAGSDKLNVTSGTNSNQVNVTTGVVSTQVNNALYSTFPLAVYPVDKVLLPYSLFGAKPPSAAPSPTSSSTSPAGSKAKPGNSPASDGAAADGGSSNSGARLSGTGAVGLIAGLIGVGIRACLVQKLNGRSQPKPGEPVSNGKLNHKRREIPPFVGTALFPVCSSNDPMWGGRNRRDGGRSQT